MVATYFYCAALLCTFRQHNHPFIGNMHFAFLWGTHRKEMISSSKEVSYIRKTNFLAMWNEEEKDGRTEQGVSGISEDYHFSKPPVFQLFAYILTSGGRLHSRRSLERTQRFFRKQGYQQNHIINFVSGCLYASERMTA